MSNDQPLVLPAHPAPVDDFPAGASTRGRAGLSRIVAAYALVGITWGLPFLASIAVLLPAKLAGMPGVDKVGGFAILTIVGSIVALLANIVFGALSDRTRSRFGGRTPWILAGALGSTLGLVLLALSESFVALLCSWLVLQLAQNAFLAAVGAVIADRVAPHRQSMVSGIYGTSNTIASAAGAVVGSLFILHVDTGFWVVAGIPVVGTVIILLLMPDSNNVGAHRTPLTAKTFMATFAFPRHARDFYWALFGRLLLVLGYFSVVNYQLYMLTDYMGQSAAQAAAIISIAGIVSLIAGVVSGLITGPISDKIDRRKLPVLIASVLIGLGALVPFFAPVPFTMVLFAGVGGFGLGMYWAVDVALVIRVLPNPETKAKDLGILNMANTGGQILAPVMVAAVVAAGGYRPVFLIAALCAIISGFLILPIKSTR